MVIKRISLGGVSSGGCRQDGIKPIPPTLNHRNDSVILTALMQLHAGSYGYKIWSSGTELWSHDPESSRQSEIKS